jgi:thiamine-phosphate pyrophosphorylase
VVKVLPSRLCAVCDADACERAGWTLVDFAAACLDGGARFLQIRAKVASSGWLLEVAQAVIRRAEGSGALIIVNDRADITRLASAGGVHVGQDDLSPSAIRPMLGNTARIGLSTHTVAQIEAASGQPIDYVGIGPVFGTATKATGYDAVGLERVGQASVRAGAANLPLVAIGGITLDRALDVLRAGAQSVAVISDLLSTGDPYARVRAYLDRLGSG